MNTELTKTRDWIQSDDLRSKVKQALPNEGEIVRFMRCLFTQVQKTPKLMDCTKDSLYSCIIQCAQLGIQPDGRLAHLIPYGKDATVIVDYKGLVELALKSGKVSYVHADVVCDEDEFVTDMGRIVTHQIDWKKSRGEPFAAYAIAKLTTGDCLCEVMTKDEIEKVRKSSRAGSSGPWKDHWSEMAKKTVFRRLCKWLPLTPEVRTLTELDDEQFERMPRVNIDPPQLPGRETKEDAEGEEQA